MTARSELAREHLGHAEAAIARGGHREALGHLKAALGTDPSQAVAHRASALAGSLDPEPAGLLPVRVAFLSDHLLGPLPRLLRADALLSDILVEPFVPEFDVWQQEIGDPGSALYASRPDVVILDLRFERLAPSLARSFLSLSADALAAEIARARDAVVGAIDVLQRRCDARAIVHSFPRPVHAALGIYDRLAETGEVAAVDRLMDEIRRAAKDRPNVFVLELDPLVAELGASAMFDPRMYAVAKLPYGAAGVARLALAQAAYLRALYGRSKKVLVLDADNTIWGGIVGEDGLDGIRLDADSEAGGHLELQRYVAELGRKGVVLALNSANERADVLEVLANRPEMILHEDDFAIVVANWRDKAENLLAIARTLDLGIDSFVFVDDDPVQCARVRAALPDVAVVELAGSPFGFAPMLARAGWFDTLTLTDEDRRRNELYRAEASRQELARLATSQEDFVGSLQVRLVASRLAPGGLARAASLTQRTNQFNLTTRRYTEADLRAIAVDPAWSAFTVRLVDRFGDIGVIGLVLLRRDGPTAVIDTFLMSCRALRRCVEDAMLAIAAHDARRAGSERVVGVYVPSARNGQVATFYPERGFSPLESAGSERRWASSGEIAFPQAVAVTYEGDAW